MDKLDFHRNKVEHEDIDYNLDTVKFIFCDIRFTGFAKCIESCTHHHSSIQNDSISHLNVTPSHQPLFSTSP